MVVPLVLVILSVAALAATLTLPEWADYQLIAAICLLASLVLLGLSYSRSGQPRRGDNWIVLDGSNVMHWKDGEPRVQTVLEVVIHLKDLGYTPGVVFDANAGYLLFGSYKHDRAFGKLLGLPEDQVMVVPKGTPADPFLLAAARDLDARIVTNDRYRDWAEDYPEVHTRGHLIRGNFRGGKLWLDLRQDHEPEPKEAAVT